MAIRLIESPEPLTGASTQEPALLIGSDGLRMLRQELRRYCDQKVSGRSFLVAGHRGSGKTTMVQGSIQRTEDEIKADWDRLRLSRSRVEADPNSGAGRAITLRPLFILLQGPNLLPSDASEAPATGSTPAASSSAETGDAPATPSSMETVLVQITLGLYRALADEFSRAYNEKAILYARMMARDGSERAKKRSRRNLELALQFELELDQYPGTGRLQEYWRLSRSLASGVLFWRIGDPRMDPGQGYRELVALSSTCQAYQRICGKLSRKDEKSRGGKSKVDAEVTVEAKGSELMKPITALLTGGAVGAGLLAANATNAPGAVCAGLATALLASFVVKYSSSRSREESMKQADLFIPDLSVATLDRVLPVLLNRIRRAGLAPVFVVDELDKVDLTARITEMVKRLKKLVAENAFFCFLTDRRYFEEMLGRTLDAPYPIEYTYFTNQLFIVFRHRDLHQYLDEVLVAPQPSSTPGNAPDLSADDRDDKQVLQYILLHDSQMHPIDLRRQLASLRNSNGEVRIAPGEVRSPRRHYPFAIRIQVAIELILDEEEMRAEIEKRPAFLQLAHDTLYYISRKWVEAPTPLDLSDSSGKKHFEEYLRSRKATNTSLGPKPEEGEGEEETEKERLEKLYLKVDGLTCDFLFGNLCKLSKYLTASDDLTKALSGAAGYPQVVIDALSREPLLVPIANQPGKYRWTHNAAGRRLDEHTGEVRPLAPQPAKESNWSEDAEVISQFQLELGELTNRQVDFIALSSQFGILKTSPAWSDARRAIERLQAAEGSQSPYPEQEDDLRCVREFRRILTDGAPAVAMALACALVIGALISAPETPVFWPLLVIADALRFRKLSPERTVNALQHLAAQFTPHIDMVSPPPISDKESVITWANWVRGAASDPFHTSETELVAFEQEAWKYWEVRLRDQVLMTEAPNLATIICHVLSRGPGVYLMFPLEEMPIERWTRIFVASLTVAQQAFGQRGGESINFTSLPIWMAMAALRHLNFDEFTLRPFLTYLQIFDPGLSVEQFTQSAPSTDQRRPAGLLLYRERCPSSYWKPSTTQPLLVCDFVMAAELIRIFEVAGKRWLQALGLSFVAFDFSRDASGLPVEESNLNLEAASSSSSAAPKGLFLSNEVSIYEFFAPDPKAPIPVMIDDPSRFPSLDTRYTMIGVSNPAELFSAISVATLRGLPS